MSLRANYSSLQGAKRRGNLNSSSLQGMRKHDEEVMDCLTTKWLAMTKNKIWIAASLLILVLTITTIPAKAAWFNGDWSSREKITIKASQVNGDLSEFPVYLNLADLPDSFFTIVNSAGADIRITQADEVTETSFELVDINTVNGTGELWFKAPLLSSTIDTNFYIYYGNPGAVTYADTDPYGTHAVWSNGFVAVYHMNESPTGLVKDSSSNNYDLISAGVMTTSDLIKGKLGNSIELDGLNDYLSPGKININSLTEISWQVWSKTSGPLFTRSLSLLHSAPGSTPEDIRIWNNTVSHVAVDNGTAYTANLIDNGANNIWHHISGTFNGNVVKSFMDGDLNNTVGSARFDFINANGTLNIGSRTFINDLFFAGSLDEIRISKNALSEYWISSEYTNQNTPGNFYLISNGQGAGFEQNLWTYFHKITIPAYILGEDLENFPVYVDLADLPTSFFATVQSSGADIRITKADQDSQQAFELVDINTVNGTGELWFKAELLSSTQDNIFYIYYGNPQAQAYSRTDEFGGENVWTEGYVGVWHMNEDPSQGQILDSTIYRNHGSSSGSMTSIDLVEAKVGKGIEFDGINDKLIIPEIPAYNWGQYNGFTASAWGLSTTAAGNPTLLRHGTSSASEQLILDISSGRSRFVSRNASLSYVLLQTNPVVLGSWRHLGWTWNGSNAIAYEDGSFGGNGSHADISTVFGAGIGIGGPPDITGDNWEGIIDEIKLSTVPRSNNWINLEEKNQKDTGVFYTIDNGDLNSTAWSNLFKITILASQVNGDLTDFPVYVNLADLPNDFFSVVNGSGADIRITTADRKTQTAFELVSLDTANGQGELWFKAPFLSGTTDTDFYLLAGNSNVQAYAEDHLFGAQNVWSNGFVAVYHMNEDPTGTVEDSTRHNNDGTSLGSMINSDLVTGQLGKAIDFDGSNDYLNTSLDPLNEVGTTMTVSGWAYSRAGNNYRGIAGAHIGSFQGLVFGQHESGSLHFGFGNASSWGHGVYTSENLNSWSAYTMLITTGLGVELFKDGLNASSDFDGATISNISNFWIGRAYNDGYRYFNGVIDEIRVSRVIRSTNWIKTEYNNQNSPSTFYTTEKVNRTNAVMFGRMF
jgi:hypothetical protein